MEGSRFDRAALLFARYPTAGEERQESGLQRSYHRARAFDRVEGERLDAPVVAQEILRTPCDQVGEACDVPSDRRRVVSG